MHLRLNHCALPQAEHVGLCLHPCRYILISAAACWRAFHAGTQEWYSGEGGGGGLCFNELFAVCPEEDFQIDGLLLAGVGIEEAEWLVTEVIRCGYLSP
jgi:hypothetical protein